MQKKIPMRQCVGCREMRPKKELVRVVKSPEGAISLDFRGKAPGRGAYLCPNSEGSHPPEVAELMMPTVLEPTGFSQKVIAKETSCVAT